MKDKPILPEGGQLLHGQLRFSFVRLRERDGREFLYWWVSTPANCATVVMYSHLGGIYHVPATRKKSACLRSSQAQLRFEGMIA